MNCSLSNLQRCLVRDQITTWDLVLPMAKFAYNNSVNKSTEMSPFQAVIGVRPCVLADLTPLPVELRTSGVAEDFIRYMMRQMKHRCQQSHLHTTC